MGYCDFLSVRLLSAWVCKLVNPCRLWEQRKARDLRHALRTTLGKLALGPLVVGLRKSCLSVWNFCLHFCNLIVHCYSLQGKRIISGSSIPGHESWQGKLYKLSMSYILYVYYRDISTYLTDILKNKWENTYALLAYSVKYSDNFYSLYWLNEKNTCKGLGT